MKINLLSDIHLEHMAYDWHLSKTDCDLVALAGDIGVGLKTYNWAIRESETLGVPILMLAGNHEYYTNDFTLVEQAKELVEGTNVHILEKDIFDFQEYKIFGTTLWTDFCLYGDAQQRLAMKTARDMMADFKLITYKGNTFTPEDSLEEHKKSINWLYNNLSSTGSNIVITHHAPTYHASHPIYRGDMLTPSFVSDYEWFILDRKPLVWASGHSHYCYRKQIGDTLCVSNTKGYPGEILNFDPELIIEV